MLYKSSNDFTLYLGDIIEGLNEIKSRSIDMIFADPPYFLSSGGITCQSGKMVSVNKASWDIVDSFDDKVNFNNTWIKRIKRILKDDGNIFISGSLHNIYIVGFLLEKNGYDIINNITWVKTNPPPNLSRKTFVHSTETILWAKKKGVKKTYFDYQLMKHINDDKQMKDVWYSSTTKKSEKKSGHHPTQKPMWLLERLILAASKEGDTILDPFSGSGTTGVVALKSMRKYIGIDIIEEYHKLFLDRIK